MEKKVVKEQSEMDKLEERIFGEKVEIEMFLEKTAVVFGGTGGIGMELCKSLLRNGLSKLAILDVRKLSEDDRRQLTLCNAATEIHSHESCDITNQAVVEHTLRTWVIPKLRRIDMVVNSAGILDERDPARLITVNLIGVINSSIAALKLMSKENPGGKGGIIVNVSSIAGLDPTPFMCIYSASKFGVTGFTRNMGHELTFNRTGVKFIALCPGVTQTPLLSRFFIGEDLLFPWMKDTILQVAQLYQPQTANFVGDCLVEAIKDGENGSVWVSNDGVNTKWKPPVSELVNRT